MPNEVEIVVSSRDRTGPGLAAARGKTQAFAASTKQTLGKAGVEAGQAFGTGIVRGADGRLRDARGRFVQAGQEAGEAFADGVVRGADGRLRDARGRFVKGGRDLGGGIEDGIKDGTERGSRIIDGWARHTAGTVSRTGVLINGAITAGLFGAAAAAAPAAGIITLALGGALTTVGMVSAAQSQKVRNTWSSVGHELRDGLADVAAPMERSAIRAARVTRTSFSKLKPFLSDFFKDSAPALDRFVKSVGAGVASLGRVIGGPLQRGYSAVLNALAKQNPEIFGSLERSIENLANTAEEHADDIAGAFQLVADTVETTTEAIGYLADQWSEFTDDVSSGKEAASDWGRSLAEGLYDLYESLGISTEQMQKMREEWAEADAAAAKSDGVKQAATSTSGLSGSARDATAGLRDLAAVMEEMTGPALDAAEAQIRVEEAIDRATKTVRKNGRTLDVNTEKGRANKESLLAIARAAQRHIATMQGEERSTEAIAKKYARYRGQLISAAMAAGRTREEARKLADAWLKTPEEVTTHVRGDLGDLKAKLAEAKRRLKDKGLTQPERAKIRAQISDLQAKVRAAKSQLASIRDKTVTIRSNYVTTHTYQSGTASLRELIPGFRQAHGGISGGGRSSLRKMATGGIGGGTPVLVGEQGPELVNLPFGSSVSPAGQTRSHMAQQGFGSMSMAFRPAAGGGGSVGGLADSMRDLASALREVIGLREGMSRWTDGVMGQGRALMAYEEAWDRVRKSLKDNGKTLNISTQKGRENRTALMDLAQAAHEVAFAMHDLGRPTSTIVAKMKEQRAEFIRMARAFGMTKKEAAALADKWGLIPSQVKKVLTKESADLAFNKKIEKTQGKSTGGVAGGWTMVGERGAELVRLPFGSQVTSANQTAALMAGGSAAPAPVVLELRSSGSAVDDMLLQILRRAVRARGGNVQLVLGRGA
jgi:hypothetical protein